MPEPLHWRRLSEARHPSYVVTRIPPQSGWQHHAQANQRLDQIMRNSGGAPSRKAEIAPALSSTGKDYAAAISRVALIGSLSTLQSALKFASRGLT